MADDLLGVLCAFAAFCVPMAFAWAAVRFGVRRHAGARRASAVRGRRRNPP